MRAMSLVSMKRLTIALLSMAGAATLMAQVPPPKPPLKVGDIAPDVELPSTQGTKVKLSGFFGLARTLCAQSRASRRAGLERASESPITNSASVAPLTGGISTRRRRRPSVAHCA